MMQAKIEEVSINKYVDYALRLRKQIDYLVGDNVDSSIKNQVVNTIWDKSLSPKVYYKPENTEKEVLKAEHKASESTSKPETREEEIAVIKRLIGRNKDNLSLLGAYAEFTEHKRVEEMTSEERKKAIEFLGGKGNDK